MQRSSRAPALAVGAVGLLAACCACSVGSGPPGALPGGTTPATLSVTGARGALSRATMTVEDGADSVDVSVADLGGDLYRILTPGDARVRPDVTAVGPDVQLHLLRGAGSGGADVRVVLAQGIDWEVVQAAGAGSLSLDLRGGEVRGIDVRAGIGDIEMVLPAPHGTVPIRMSSGASSWTLTRPAQAPVRVQARAGAGTVRVDQDARDGVAAGTVLASPGWADAADRYDVDAVAGVSSLVVDAFPASQFVPPAPAPVTAAGTVTAG